MLVETSEPLKIFYCYAKEDEELRNELDKHLASLKRQYSIVSWSDDEISPGRPREEEIRAQLDTAHIILLLISCYFLASDDCYRQMERALERHEAGSVRVIPILLRHVDHGLFDTLKDPRPKYVLKVLPTDAKPVAGRDDRHEAYSNIAAGIREVVRGLPYLIKPEGKLEQQKILVAALQLLTSHFLSEGEQQILRRLAKPESDSFVARARYPDLYAAQFRNLLDRKFIKRTDGGSFSIFIEQILNGEKVNVREYVRIANAGVQYLNLLDQVSIIECTEEDN